MKLLGKFLDEWKTTIFVLFGIVALAGFLRLVNLTYLPVFADEAIYIRWSQIMANESTLRFLPLSDGKQPLYMWVLMTVIDLFSDPLFAGRFVSVVTGLGSVIGIFAVSFLLFKNKSVSLVASFFWAISPFAVFFDRMALVDSMLSFWGIWTLFFAILTAKYKRIDTALFAGFCLGFAWLTKSPALFFVLLIPTTWFVTTWPKNKKSKLIHLIKLAVLSLLTVGLGFAMYNIMRLGPNFHLIASRNLDYVHPYSHFFKSPTDPMFPHIDRAFEWIRMLGPGYIVLFVLAAFISKDFKYLKERLLLLAWFAVPLVITAEYAKVYTARYILYMLPALMILAASSFLDNRLFSKKLLYLFLGVFALHSLVINNLLLTNIQAAPLPRSERSGYLEEWTSGTGIKQVADFIKEEHLKNPDEKIVVGTEGYFGTLPDGLQMYLQNVPNVLVIGVGLDFGEVPKGLIESKAAGNKTYFVVNSSRLKLRKEFGEYGLKVIKEFKKADRPDGIREYVQYGLNDTFYFFEVE